MGSRKVLFYFDLQADGNDPVEREKLIMQEREKGQSCCAGLKEQHSQFILGYKRGVRKDGHRGRRVSSQGGGGLWKFSSECHLLSEK